MTISRDKLRKIVRASYAAQGFLGAQTPKTTRQLRKNGIKSYQLVYLFFIILSISCIFGAIFLDTKRGKVLENKKEPSKTELTNFTYYRFAENYLQAHAIGTNALYIPEQNKVLMQNIQAEYFDLNKTKITEIKSPSANYNNGIVELDGGASLLRDGVQINSHKATINIKNNTYLGNGIFSINSEDITANGIDLEYKQNKIYAKNITIKNKDSIISAKNFIGDENTRVAHLKNSVKVSKGTDLVEANEAFIYFDSKNNLDRIRALNTNLLYNNNNMKAEEAFVHFGNKNSINKIHALKTKINRDEENIKANEAFFYFDDNKNLDKINALGDVNFNIIAKNKKVDGSADKFSYFPKLGTYSLQNNTKNETNEENKKPTRIIFRIGEDLEN